MPPISGRSVHRNRSFIVLYLKTCECTTFNPQHRSISFNINLFFLSFFQSIPSDMQFDPNSNPHCYKTKDEVCKCFHWYSNSLKSCVLNAGRLHVAGSCNSGRWRDQVKSCWYSSWCIRYCKYQIPNICVSWLLFIRD